MIIEAVKKDKKHLTKVTCDNEYVFFLDNDVEDLPRLKSGMYLSNEYLKELLQKSDYIRAKSKALWYLDRCDHTQKGLNYKLIKSGFSSQSANKVIEKLKELGLIDDRRFAFNFAEKCLKANISQRQTYVKLLEKGIEKNLAKEAINSFETDEVSQIKAVVDKKYKNKISEKEGIAKVYAALVRRGFSFDAVKEVLKQYSEELKFAEE